MILQTSCSPTASFTSERWAGQGDVPAAPKGLSSTQGILKVGDQQVQFLTQKVEGVEIEGSYFKKLSHNGIIQFQDFRWMTKIPVSVRRDLILMRAQKSFVLSSFRKNHLGLNLTKLIGGPELHLEMEETPQPSWKLVFEESDGTLEAYFLNRKLNLVSQRTLGSNMIDTMASLYPMGPLKSKVQQVLLKDLIDADSLSTTKVKVMSESGQLAFPGPNNELNFAVEDARFSQVQALYYMTEALDWFEHKLSFKLPFILEVETEKGFPDKTNTAFYFQQKVRLGEGDGIVFDHIPLDPSIVTHETSHAIIDAVAGLPFQGEGGSINEAFADFFAASLLDNPKLGEVSYKTSPFKRTVENEMAFSEKTGGLYHDSGIVSGLLWSISKSVGEEAGRRIAWQTLLRLNPFTDFASLKQEIVTATATESPEIQSKVHAIMAARGW